MFRLHFETYHSAFDNDAYGETARVLQEIASAIHVSRTTEGTICDIDGNPIGKFRLDRTPPNEPC